MDSNHRRPALQAGALPTELCVRIRDNISYPLESQRLFDGGQHRLGFLPNDPLTANLFTLDRLKAIRSGDLGIGHRDGQLALQVGQPTLVILLPLLTSTAIFDTPLLIGIEAVK